MDVPIFTIILVAGIIISAIMSIITGKEERKKELEMIEREGEVYMQRLKEARNKNAEPEEIK